MNVPMHDLLLIRSDGDYSKVHLEDGQVFYQKTTMKEWETLLRPPHFLRVHKSAIVALPKAIAIDRTGGNWTLQIRGSDQLVPVGRSYRPAIRQHLQF